MAGKVLASGGTRREHPPCEVSHIWVEKEELLGATTESQHLRTSGRTEIRSLLDRSSLARQKKLLENVRDEHANAGNFV
eukprot:2931283-Rhodomonas_salina.3